jgi:hypothetical protein
MGKCPHACCRCSSRTVTDGGPARLDFRKRTTGHLGLAPKDACMVTSWLSWLSCCPGCPVHRTVWRMVQTHHGNRLMAVELAERAVALLRQLPDQQASVRRQVRAELDDELRWREDHWARDGMQSVEKKGRGRVGEGVVTSGMCGISFGPTQANRRHVHRHVKARWPTVCRYRGRSNHSQRVAYCQGRRNRKASLKRNAATG